MKKKEKVEEVAEDINKTTENTEETEIVEADQFDPEKLSKIEKELKEDKTPKSKLMKRKKIFGNVLLAIAIEIYFLIILFGSKRIPTIEFVRDMKIFMWFDVIVAIGLLERSFRKDVEALFLNGIEIIVVAGSTMFLTNYFTKVNEIINLPISIAAGVVVGYYLIKSIVLAIKKGE